MLLRIKKGATLEQAEQAVGWTHGLGIDTRGSFMLALPGETPEKAMNTIKFAIKLNVTFAQFLNTYPEWGTELHDDAIQSGKIMHLYKGRTAVTYVPDGYKNAEEVRFYGKRALAVNYALSLNSDIGNAIQKKGYHLGIIWQQRGEKIIVSLRSTNSIDSSKIAQRFGGGGHKKAAAFRLPISIKFPWKRIKK